MKDYDWNEPRQQLGAFWDTDLNEAEPYRQETRSDKSIVNYPCGYEYRVALEALCRVVSELVEIEEKRNG